ncbi:MAG: hypothetical protein IJ706_02115 [Clostridia bacterium]|nr:hypothetical protein [Clostridia bacterium]
MKRYEEMPKNYEYIAPPTELLSDYESAVPNEKWAEAISETILNTVKTEAKTNAEITGITYGASITRFEVKVSGNTPVKAVLGCEDELNFLLKDRVMISSVYGTEKFAFDVPNEVRGNVGLKQVIEGNVSVGKNTLIAAIGKDVSGVSVEEDVVKMPHLLIGGAAGSGKSVVLNSILISLMYRYSPADLRFMIIDPKRVEYVLFEDMPHLLFDKILGDVDEALNALKWLSGEINRRFNLMREAAVRNVGEYNEYALREGKGKLYRLVVVIDEFGDIATQSFKEFDNALSLVLMKARAAGIHIILATQRISPKIMASCIKYNVPSRIALRVSCASDSKTLIEEGGAENLIGGGDMFVKTAQDFHPRRVQGAYISLDEVKAVVEFIKLHNDAYFDEKAKGEIATESKNSFSSVFDFLGTAKRTNGGSKSEKSVEPTSDAPVSKDNLAGLYLAISLGTISISMIQRRLRFGFPKSAGIVDWMEREGYIVRGDGKQNQVTMTKEQYDEKYGNILSDEEFSEKYDNF